MLFIRFYLFGNIYTGFESFTLKIDGKEVSFMRSQGTGYEYIAEYIDDVILLDDYDTPKQRHLYYLFNEVMYFSTFKKIKIIECKPIQMLKRDD